MGGVLTQEKNLLPSIIWAFLSLLIFPYGFPLAPLDEALRLRGMKFGIIGCGKMGSALVRGMLSTGICTPKEIQLCDRDHEIAADLAKATGASLFTDAPGLSAASEVILLCVKPDDVRAVVTKASTALTDKLLISIVAGTTLASLQTFAPKARVVRVMPNTGVLVQKGATAYATGTGVTDADAATVGKIFSAVGLAFAVKESLLDAVTGLSGSGPAYVYLFIEALSDGGVQMGLPRNLATSLALQTVAGAAAMVQETGLHPAVLREMVTSPGGTTIAGLAELERTGLRSAVINAVRAATIRSQELGTLRAND